MAEPLPPGELQQSVQPQLYATVVVTRALAFLAVGLRFWARRRGGVSWWWDDWLVLGLTVFVLIPEFGLAVAVIALGTGRHVAALEPQDLAIFLKAVYVDTLTYPLVITPVKCSILCLYIRLFSVHGWFRRACQLLLCVSIIWGLVTFFLFAFQCSPIADAWTPTREGCIDFDKLFLGTNIPNVIVDFLILALPLQPIWSLQIPTIKKVIINSIIAVGVAEVAISIVRVATLSRPAFDDISWDDATALTWSEVECHVGVICCNLPVLAPLLPAAWREKLRDNSTFLKPKASAESVPLGYLRHADASEDGQQSLGRAETPSGGIRRTTDIRVTDEDAGPKGYPGESRGLYGV